MSEVLEQQNEAIKGGEWLIRTTEPQDIFIPEEWSEEHKMIAKSAMDFLAAEVYPNLDRIDSMEEGLMPSLMDKAGELGMLEELGNDVVIHTNRKIGQMNRHFVFQQNPLCLFGSDD